MVAGPNIIFAEHRTLAHLALQARLPSSFPAIEFVEEEA
jgi:hypothetical protein